MGFLSDIFKSITGAIGDVVGWLLGIEEPNFEDQNRGALVNKQSNVAAIPVIYGTRKVGGTRVFVSTGGGKKNEYLYLAIVLCEGEIDSIGDVYINDVLSTDSKYSGLVSIEKYTGTDSQTYSTLLAGADDTWGTNHRLRGVAYLALRLKYDPDVFSSLPEVQAIVRGKKVYNPDTATTEYSSNPAYCLRDYLTNTRYGKGLDSSLIDDTSFIAAANFCDTTVVSSTDSGLGQKIFECNAVIDTGQKLFDNVKIILRGMRGLMPYSNGVYSLLIDKAESVSFDLTPDNITSDIQVASSGKDKKFNKVIAKFTNPEANWQSDTVFWPPSGSTEETTFLSEDDNQELSNEINLPTISNYYSARDIARIACLSSRKNDLTVRVTATSEALSIAAGDVVRLSHPSMGWIDDGTTDARQTFRVAGLQLVNTGEVKLTLQKYDSTIYPWEVGALQPDNEASTLPDPTLVAQPTNLSVIAGAKVETDGTTLPYLDISWTAADDAFVDKYEVTVTPSSGNAVTLTVTNEAYRYFVTDTSLTYVVSVRSLNSLGFRSTALSSSSVSAVVDTTAPSVPSSPSVTGTFKQIEVRWTNPTDSDFSYIEIKRSGTSVEGDAVVIAQTRGDYYFDGPYDGILTRYYWIRAVDFTGNASAWVYAGSGTTVKLIADDFAEGVIDITYITTEAQDLINGAIQESDLTVTVSALDDAINDVIDGIYKDVSSYDTERTELVNSINLKADETDLEAARNRIRAIEFDSTALYEDILRTSLLADQTSGLVRDAGIVVDPANGQVTIQAVEQLRQATDVQLNEVQITLDAQEAAINLKASTTYVNDAIAAAVLDPAEIIEFTGIEARLSTAEADIDALESAITLKADLTLITDSETGLNVRVTQAEADIDALDGQITLKVDSTDFDALEDRVSSAEIVIDGLDVPSITQTVIDTQSLKKELDIGAGTTLRDILNQYKTRESLRTDLALARQSISADVTENRIATATARTELLSLIDDNTASIISEQTTRASEDAALATSITQLTATVDANTGSITAINNVAVDSDSVIAQAVATLQGTVSGNTASITEINTVSVDSESAIAQAVANLQSDVGDNTAAISTEQTTRADADSAQATRTTLLQAQTNFSIDSAANLTLREIMNQYNSRQSTNTQLAILRESASADVSQARDAIVQTRQELLAAVDDNTSLIVNEQTARANADSALAQTITTLTARVGDTEGSIVEINNVSATSDSAIAVAVSSLNTTVGENTATLTEVKQVTDGVSAQYTVTIDNNNHVSGFGLVSDIIDGNPTSAFIVNADQFAIGGAGVISNDYPFVVYTTNTTVNKGGTNYTIPAGVYIEDAFIQEASIDTANIRNLSVETAKIGANAVTFPRFVTGSTNLDINSSSFVFVATLSNVTRTGAPAQVQAGGVFSHVTGGVVDNTKYALFDVAIYAGSTEIKRINNLIVGGRNSPSIVLSTLHGAISDTTYYLLARKTGGTADYVRVVNSYISFVELKR